MNEAAPTIRVGVVADDLIWASRLVTAVERAGASPVQLTSQLALTMALEATTVAEPAEVAARLIGCVVDLNGRAYDGVEAVRASAAARLPVIAVGQHEDLELRKRALEAGALRVFSYNKAFTDGAALVGMWLVRAGGAAGPPVAPEAADPAEPAEPVEPEPAEPEPAEPQPAVPQPAEPQPAGRAT